MDESFRVEITADAAAFLDRVGEWLAKDPVPTTVLSTIAHRARAAEASGEDPRRGLPYWWFAVVEGPGGEVVGAAMRTAPFAPYPAYLLGMPGGAAEALADAVLDRGEEVGGVSGVRPATDVFAARVAARTGAGVEVNMHNRLFELGELVEPAPVPGRLRPVRPDEAELALRWIREFFRDADVQAGREPGSGHDAEHFTLDDVERKLREGVLWFWVDAQDLPVNLTGANPPAFGTARIGPVFTPAELRGKGYGGAAVAAVSRLLRKQGSRPILFTDQDNPVSNGLYQRLGYRPVLDTVELHLRS